MSLIINQPYEKNFIFTGNQPFTLQSCTVNSEIVFHKDAASTTLMDIDMKDLMAMFKSMMPDSVKNDKELAELEKLPNMDKLL
jgi:hypothetical protein